MMPVRHIVHQMRLEMDDNTILYRQKGRAAKLRSWAEQGRVEEEKKRSRLRAAARARVEKHKAALDLLRLEKELESRRCKTCDMVRAQAWGLGHANWMERRCGACWANLAEQSALERHYSQMPVARSAEAGALTLLPPALLQALRSLEGSLAGPGANLLSSMHPSTRSGRVPLDMSQTSLPTSPNSAARGVTPPQQNAAGGSPPHSTQAREQAPAGSSMVNEDPADTGKTQHQPEGSALPQQQAHVASMSEPTRPGPQDHTTTSPGDPDEVSSALKSRDFVKLLELLGPQQVKAYLATLEGAATRPHSPPTKAGHTHGQRHTQLTQAPTASHPHYAFARRVAAEEHAAVRARDQQWLDSVRDASSKSTNSKLTQLVVMPPVGQALGTTSPTASAGGAAPKPHKPGAGGTSGDATQANSAGGDTEQSKPLTAEERRMQWSLTHESTVEDELEKLQEQLVFGVTQKERTAALLQLHNLRAELAVLRRDNRRYRKVLEARKHAVRSDPAHASGLHGVKRVVGRQVPPETGMPLSTLFRGELMPGVTVIESKQRHGSSSPHRAGTQAGAEAKGSPPSPKRDEEVSAPQHTTSPYTTTRTTAIAAASAAGVQRYMPSPSQLRPSFEDGGDPGQPPVLRPPRDEWAQAVSDLGPASPVFTPMSGTTAIHNSNLERTATAGFDQGPGTAGQYHVGTPAGITPHLLSDQYSTAAASGRPGTAGQLQTGPTHRTGTQGDELTLSPSPRQGHKQRRHSHPPAHYYSYSRSVTGQGKHQLQKQPWLAAGPVLTSRVASPLHGSSHHNSSWAQGYGDSKRLPPAAAPIQEGTLRALEALLEATGHLPPSKPSMMRELAGQGTHPDSVDPYRQADQVTWRPSRTHATPLPHPPGYQSVGDYLEYDPLAEFAKLRSMRVDDYKLQLRKKKEWERAVLEAQRELGKAQQQAQKEAAGQQAQQQAVRQ